MSEFKEAPMNEFETRPVSEISSTTSRGAWINAFAELPHGIAMFKPDANPNYYSALVSKFPHRKIHQSQDKAKGGRWYWWEPRA